MAVASMEACDGPRVGASGSSGAGSCWTTARWTCRLTTGRLAADVGEGLRADKAKDGGADWPTRLR